MMSVQSPVNNIIDIFNTLKPQSLALALHKLNLMLFFILSKKLITKTVLIFLNDH